MESQVAGWTDSRYYSFIVSALRSASSRYPPKYECLKASRTEKKTNPKTGRLAQHFKCVKCNEEFTSKDVQVDHIKPVIDPKMGFISWDVYIERLFCPIKNFQVLCKVCHLEKSKKERTIANRQKNPN